MGEEIVYGGWQGELGVEGQGGESVVYYVLIDLQG